MADERKIAPVLLNDTGLIMANYLNDIAERLGSASDYKPLTNKPLINGRVLQGGEDRKLQEVLVGEGPGQNIKTIAGNNVLGTGNIIITKEDVGLGNVDNTRDADKPVSNATRDAIQPIKEQVSRHEGEIRKKQDVIRGDQLLVLESGITKESVEKFNNYETVIKEQGKKIIEIKSETIVIGPTIDAHIAEIGETTIGAEDNKAIAGLTVGVVNGKMKAEVVKEIDIPVNNNQLANGMGYVTMPQVKPKIDSAIEEAVKGVFVNHTDDPNIIYNGDTVTLKTTFTDIATKATDTKSEQIKLADSVNAGLMSPADVKQIAENTTKIKSLSGQAARSLYVVNEDLKTIEGHENAFYINGKLYNLDVTTNPYTVMDCSTTPPSVVGQCDPEGNIEINGTDFNFYYDPIAGIYKGKRPETKKNIDKYAKDQGYVEPYTGLSIVIEGSSNIWRYYPNKEDGKVIGWKNDGVDTVQKFTNTAAGIILGSLDPGQIYAENDGKGSVNGWSDLTTRVSNLEARPTNTMTFTYGTVIPSTGAVGQVFIKTDTCKVYIYNGTKFEAMNTYQ